MRRCVGVIGILFGILYLYAQVDLINGQQMTKVLQEKTDHLKELRSKKQVIPLRLHQFKEFVRSAPRDYSFIVMFTALAPNRHCAICQHVYEEYKIVANSHLLSVLHYDKMFFGIVDFDEGSDIFQMLRLNTAPVIMHFPPKGKPKPADTMDLERMGIHAEAIAKFVEDRTGIPVQVLRPPNYAYAIAVLILLLFTGGVLYMRWNNLHFLYNKQLWAVAAVFFCFAMVSGQMWNQIRGPPFLHKGKNGPVYINGSSNGQFILESYIVMMMNGAVVIGMILIIESAGGVRPSSASLTATESKKRRFMSIAGLILVCVFFSLLLSVFKAKTQGYPYSFLFK